jgi:hypothetical protein
MDARISNLRPGAKGVSSPPGDRAKEGVAMALPEVGYDIITPSAPRRIALVVALGLVGQTVALAFMGAWYMSDIENEIDLNSQNHIEIGKTFSSVHLDVRNLDTRQDNADMILARFDEKIISLNLAIEKLDEFTFRVMHPYNYEPE